MIRLESRLNKSTHNHDVLFMYFSATIARNRYRFWMGVQSQVIMDDAGGPAPKTCSYQTRYVAPNDTSGASFHHISVLAILFVVFNLFMFA